jgi:hypothetical protein
MTIIRVGPGPNDTPLRDDSERQEQIRSKWKGKPEKDLLDEIIRLRIELEHHQQSVNLRQSGDNYNPKR